MLACGLNSKPPGGEEKARLCPVRELICHEFRCDPLACAKDEAAQHNGMRCGDAGPSLALRLQITSDSIPLRQERTQSAMNTAG